jgi:hypothetical protein
MARKRWFALAMMTNEETLKRAQGRTRFPAVAENI